MISAAPQNNAHRRMAVIAGGQSLDASQLQLVRAASVPAVLVNDAYRLAPWGDWLYGADGEWWDHHIGRVRETFHGECWTIDKRAAEAYGLNLVKAIRADGLSRELDVIHTGMCGNSGHQAINLAHHFGARKIFLLGFDCHATGRKHWFGDHPGKLNKPSPYAGWLDSFDSIPSMPDWRSFGLSVINCSPGSAIRAFPHMPLREALCGLV